MKKFLMRMLLTAAILCLAAVTVFAANDDFNAGLTITKTDTSISVTVQDSDVLAEKIPKLTIPCTNMNWEGAKVTFGTTVLTNVVWDAENKTVTFPVAAGGTYVIEEAQKTAEEGNATTQKPSVQGPSALKPVEQKPMNFTDVKASDWFYADVKFVWERGLMNGVGGSKFAPNDTLTRAMVVQVLYNLAGKPAAGAESFSDVAAGDWYRDAVAWAAANGIVKGMDAKTFAPMSPVTREQLAAMLFRYAVYNGMNAMTLAEYLGQFPDAGQVSDWAVSAMNWAVGQGLINGMDGKLAPKGSATRAQTAAILARFCR